MAAISTCGCHRRLPPSAAQQRIPGDCSSRGIDSNCPASPYLDPSLTLRVTITIRITMSLGSPSPGHDEQTGTRPKPLCRQLQAESIWFHWDAPLAEAYPTLSAVIIRVQVVRCASRIARRTECPLRNDRFADETHQRVSTCYTHPTLVMNNPGFADGCGLRLFLPVSAEGN